MMQKFMENFMAYLKFQRNFKKQISSIFSFFWLSQLEDRIDAHLFNFAPITKKISKKQTQQFCGAE